jgi:hypothetical protein
MAKARHDIICDLHEWPERGQRYHILDRECMCDPTVKNDGKSPNSFLVIHKDR